jgi:hypothetical protein
MEVIMQDKNYYNLGNMCYVIKNANGLKELNQNLFTKINIVYNDTLNKVDTANLEYPVAIDYNFTVDGYKLISLQDALDTCHYNLNEFKSQINDFLSPYTYDSKRKPFAIDSDTIQNNMQALVYLGKLLDY